MKTRITAAVITATALLVLATPALAASKHTATAAQWKDINRLYDAVAGCAPSEKKVGDEWIVDATKPNKECILMHKLQKKLERQDFCFWKTLNVGRLAWHGPEEDRVKLWPKGGKQCYEIHDPAH